MRRTAALVAAALSLGMAACGDDAHAAGELLDDEPVATGAAGEADTFRIRYASVDVGGDAS